MFQCSDAWMDLGRSSPWAHEDPNLTEADDDGLGPTVEVQHAWANFSRPQQEASPAARITKDKENGFGEGEVQALHHAWMLSQLTGGATKGARLFEIMSIDTDVWVAALLVYCVFPSTQNVRVVVRSQRGVGSTRECQQIDVLQLFDDITHLPHWPAEFTPLQRCLPVIAAYVLCGTDFTPTLHGITSASMFGAYYQFAKNAGNFGFVRPLGDAEKDGQAFVGLNVREEECVKFVGLCYFEKNKKLFESPDPGKQVKGGVEPDPTKEWIDHIAWRTYVKHFGRAHWQKVVPDFDVLELHVLRLRWLYLTGYRRGALHPPPSTLSLFQSMTVWGTAKTARVTLRRR
ncbi:unnamed protein product [Ectocarpus sp. 12 AP-2014]